MSGLLVCFILASPSFLLSVGLFAGVPGCSSCAAVVLVLCHWGSRGEMRAAGFCFYLLMAH